MASPITSVEHEGFTIQSNSESEDQLREQLGKPPEEQEVSDAAKKLGQKGGEAAAKAREAKKDEKPELKAKPIKDKPKAKEEPKVEPEEKPDEAEPEQEAKADDKAEEPEPEPEKPSKKGNPRYDPTARVAEATRQTAEYRRRAEAAEARLAQLEQERSKPAEKVEAKAEPKDDAPKEEDFQNYGDFVKASIKYEAKQIARAEIDETVQRINAAERTQRLEQAHNQRVEEWGKALEAAEAADPEFSSKLSEEVMSLPWAGVKPGEKATNKHILAQIILSKPEYAAQTMLALDDGEIQRLSTLHPTLMGWELGRIAGSLHAATSGKSVVKKEPRVSGATPPVPPVAGAPLTAEQDITEIADFDRFASVRTAQLRAKQAQR